MTANRQRLSFLACTLLGLAPAGACSSDRDEQDDIGQVIGPEIPGSGFGGHPPVVLAPMTSAIPIANAGAAPYMLPDGFTRAERGGFKLGDPFNGEEPPENAKDVLGDACTTTILGVVRDFLGKTDAQMPGSNQPPAENPKGHPDFETYAGNGATQGLVAARLGDDRKPVYTGLCESPGKTDACPSDRQTTNKAAFDQWYRYTENVNAPFVVYFSLEASNDADPKRRKLTFLSHDYFPLDGKGLGNQGFQRNYHFTTEIHTLVGYEGGETFEFIGDDDVWVFVNGHLALDLGGLHEEVRAQIDFDAKASAFGLEKGKIYPFDLFHAERHSYASNFRIETNLQFRNCGEIVPEPPLR